MFCLARSRSSNSLRMRNYTCKDSWYANLLLSIETLNAGRKYFTCYKLYLQMTPLMSSNNTNLRIYMMPFKRYDLTKKRGMGHWNVCLFIFHIFLLACNNLVGRNGSQIGQSSCWCKSVLPTQIILNCNEKGLILKKN